MNFSCTLAVYIFLQENKGPQKEDLVYVCSTETQN